MLMRLILVITSQYVQILSRCAVRLKLMLYVNYISKNENKNF